MKKLIIGIAAVLVLSTIGAGVHAARFIPDTENIFNTANSEDCDRGFGSQRCSTVSTFKHNGNRCYVLKNANNDAQSISCVRFEK